MSNTALAMRAGLTTSTSTIITRQNLAELPKIAALSRELGAQRADFNRYLTPIAREGQSIRGGPLADMMPTQNELHAAISAIEKLRIEANGSHQISYGPCIPQCFAPSSSVGCSAGETFLVVDPWGNVKPCADTALDCGNLLTQTVEEIWWSKEMQRWRELVPSECSVCAALYKCRGGCRAMVLASGLERDPLMQGAISRTDDDRWGIPAPIFTHSLDSVQSHTQHLDQI